MKTQSSLPVLIQARANELVAEVETMDVEAVARSTGFQKRKQRKIDLRHMALGILSLAATGHLCFERVAAAVARRAKRAYSKQALHKRLNASIVEFLAALFIHCLQPALREGKAKGLFATFNRVLLHDSTTVLLPDRYAKDFPGSTNQRKTFSQLKLQVVCDLLCSRVEQVSISGFTRNDQRAAADILEHLHPGDLVIRDLGYFVLSVFRDMIQRRAFFISRYRHDVIVLDPFAHCPILLAKHLKKYGYFDGEVLLGKEALVPVRLVAVAVPDDVANQRRRQLRQNRNPTHNPSKEHLFLMGWNIFVTNVSAAVWSSADLRVVYRFRWRIETLFKAWKSYLRLAELRIHCPNMLRLSIMTKLIFCALVYRTSQDIETIDPQHRHVSLLRFAAVLSNASLYFEAAVHGLSVQQLIGQLIQRHAFYEKRRDRQNFQEKLAGTWKSTRALG